MRIDTIENDRLFKLLSGFSLLDDRDRERIIDIVDTLDFAVMKTNGVQSCSNEEVEHETA